MRLRHDDSGFALVEILVSAVLVAIIGVGVMAGLDTASSATGRNKMRGAAASLAQQDQERLHGMKISALDGLNSSRDVPVCTGTGGSCITYHVVSRTDWVADTGTAASCVSAGGEGYNLKLTSTVTWPGMAAQGLAPVVEESMLAPTVSASTSTVGTLAVKVVRADGSAAGAGLTVTLGGAGTGTATTNSQGCAVFDSLAAGSYTATLNQPGWTDSTLTQSVTKSATVVGQRLTSITFTYDQPSTASISFFSKIGSVTWPATTDKVNLFQGTNTRTFGSGPTQSPITTTAVFPGTWSVYAGCTGAKPSLSPFSDPVATLPLASNVTGANIPATGSNPPGPGLQLPSYNVSITAGGATVLSPPVPASKIPTVKMTSTTCAGFSYTQNVLASGTNAGKLTSPGFPYGTYTVCASAWPGSGGNGASQRWKSTTVTLADLTSGSTTIDVKSSGSTPC